MRVRHPIAKQREYERGARRNVDTSEVMPWGRAEETEAKRKLRKRVK